MDILKTGLERGNLEKITRGCARLANVLYRNTQRIGVFEESKVMFMRENYCVVKKFCDYESNNFAILSIFFSII